MQIESKSLKRSWMVMCLAVGLILAPIGNYAITAWSVAFLDSGHVSALLRGFQYLTMKDIAIELLLVCSGVLLLRQHKYSWLLAIALLTGLSLVDFFKMINLFGMSAPLPEKLQIVVGLMTTVAATLVLFFLKYPFVDRRVSWLANEPRFATAGSCVFKIGNATFDGRLVSISKSGARIQINGVLNVPSSEKFGQFVGLDNEFEDFKIVEHNAEHLRLKWKTKINDLGPWLGRMVRDSALKKNSA